MVCQSISVTEGNQKLGRSSGPDFSPVEQSSTSLPRFLHEFRKLVTCSISVFFWDQKKTWSPVRPRSSCVHHWSWRTVTRARAEKDFGELYPKTYSFCALKWEVPNEKVMKRFEELNRMRQKSNLQAQTQSRAGMMLGSREGTTALVRLEQRWNSKKKIKGGCGVFIREKNRQNFECEEKSGLAARGQ